uniref:Uncharacterized protein n=1 Tax=Triticum aestivum TaxID=4565 RepID=A0A3B6I5I2_WHEAT
MAHMALTDATELVEPAKLHRARGSSGKVSFSCSPEHPTRFGSTRGELDKSSARVQRGHGLRDFGPKKMILSDRGDGVMSYSFYLWPRVIKEVLYYLAKNTITILLKRENKRIYLLLVGVACCLFFPIVYLLCLVVGVVAWVIYTFGAVICAGISLWRIIQHDYGNMDGDNSKANLMPALDFFYSLILCQGALYILWQTSNIVFRKMWGETLVKEYLVDIQSKCWRDPKSIKGRRLVNYAVDLLDSESSQDYLSGAEMLDVLIKRGVDVRPLILPSSQKVQKLIDTLRKSSSDREIKELAARILAHLACDRDLTQFPGVIPCISSLLLGTTTQLPYWNNQQGSSNQSPQSDVFYQLFAEIKESKLGLLLLKIIEKGKLDQQGARGSQGDRDTTLPYCNNQHQSPQSRLDQQGAADSEGEGDGWNELILQGLTILERLASDQHNCRDICSTPDLMAKIMSPIYSDTLIQDINIMPWQDVVNGALRVVYRLIRAPEWTGGRRLAHEISCSKQAVSNLEMILNQGNIACQQLQMRAMEILTELTLDSPAKLALGTKENMINKQLQIFLDEGKEEDLRVTAGKNSADNLAIETKEKLIGKQLQIFLDEGKEEKFRVTAGKTLASLSKTGTTISACIMSEYNPIVEQMTEILDAKNKVIYRTIAAEILENLCTLHTMDKNHVRNNLLQKVSEAPLDVQENQLHDDEENQRLEHNVQIKSSDQNETYKARMELKEALLSLTSVIFDKLIINAEDFDDVARKVAPGEGEFVAKLKTIVEENCEATANSLRIVKLCGQIAVTMMKRSQYIAHFKDQKFVESLSEVSRKTCNLESCMLFAGTDGGAKKTARPLLFDLVKEAEVLVA